MNEKKDQYFLIYNSDGDTYVSKKTKNQIKDIINEDSDLNGKNCISELKESNTNYWDNEYLIIKGKIIIPREKEKIIEYDIE